MYEIIGQPMQYVNRQTYLNFIDNELMTIFGERLKQARLEAGLSQGELAALVGIKQATVAEAESIGKSSKKILDYAKAF
ncbi:MAG TPA: helix-turn-helix transcriptional regulator, partial [Methylotenera sp.]|nr:helix-turn-helix transcriptional regulator [Methylotenera sp.]